MYPPSHFASFRWLVRAFIAQNRKTMREMVISTLHDVSMDRGVRLVDVDACGGVGCLLHTLTTRSLRPQVTLLVLELLKKLTRRFSLDMVDRVVALDGPRVVGALLADEFGMADSPSAESVRGEIVSRSLLLLCRWAALSPSRLRDTFDDFWKVLLHSFGSADRGDEQERHLAYAFCGMCVLSIDHASKIVELCVELEGNMRAVCAGLDAYCRRFPCDRLPRAVVTAMMTLRGDTLVERALRVEGMSFVRAGGGMAGAAILRGAQSPDKTEHPELADFVATSVGVSGIFCADADAGARKRIVCELLEDDLLGDELCGRVCGVGDDGGGRVGGGRAAEVEASEPSLRKETSVDSIVLDTLCRDNDKTKMGVVGETRMPRGKRGLELISEAYQEKRPAKRVCRALDAEVDGGRDSDADSGRRQHCPDPFTIRIGGSTAVAVSNRRRLADLIGLVSLFEDDGSENLDLPGSLPGTVPDEDRFARACIEVLRFVTGDIDDVGIDDVGIDDVGIDDVGIEDNTDGDDPRQERALDRWIVADYLGVSCDRLHAALFRASTAQTIERLLLRFPHLAPTVARCAWQRYSECGMPGGLARGSPVSRLLIENVYDHLCDTLLVAL